MVKFTDIKYNENFIWAKAYHPRTKRFFDVEIDLNKIDCKITPDDYSADIMVASYNLYDDLKKDKFLPEKKYNYVGVILGQCGGVVNPKTDFRANEKAE